MAKARNKYVDTKVAALNAVEGPAGGVAMWFRFNQHVTVDGNEFVFPLDEDQFVSLVKIVNGIAAQRGLEELRNRKVLRAIDSGAIKVV